MLIKQWNGQTGLFNTDAAWSPTGTPGTADLASLGGINAYDVSTSGTAIIGGLVISGPRANLGVSGVLASLTSIDIESGTVAAGTSGALLAVTSIGNAGVIRVAAGHTLTLGAGTLVNSGTFLVSGGTITVPASFVIAGALRGPIGVSNTGTISLTNGGLLDISANALTWAALTAGTISIDRASTLALAGTLGLGGATVNFRPDSLLHRVEFRGETLSNGTVDAAGAVFGGNELTLSQVRWSGSWTVPAGMTVFADATSSIAGGTLSISAGGRLLETGTLDNLTIALGVAGANGTATLAGTILADGQSSVVGPTLGANIIVRSNGNAVLGLARNFGTVLVQSGSLMLSGNANGTSGGGPYSPVTAINHGSIVVNGGVLRLDSYSDYQPGIAVATGQIIVGNGGVVEVDFVSAQTSTGTQANIIFADGAGTLSLATAAGTAPPAVIAVGGFTDGDSIIAVNGSVSQFDAASQTLLFLDPASGLARAQITFASGHHFAADELIGLGGASIATSFVAAANILPAFVPGTRQWLGLTGNFNDASQWTPSGVPGAGETASLAGIVAYVASQSGTTTVVAATINNALATLTVGGTLSASAGLALEHGVLYLPGTLRDTIVTQTAGYLREGSAGTLSNVTWIGDLTAAAGLTIRNGISVLGADGVADGRLTVASGTVTIADRETLDHVTIDLGATLVAAAGLTLGNHATLEASAGTTSLLATGSLTNAGHIKVRGGTLTLGGSGTTGFSNTGSIRVAAGAELDLTAGNITLADLLAGTIAIDPAGILVLTGTLDLGGVSLDFRAGSPLSKAVLRGATLMNGTVDADAGEFSFSSLALGNIVWRGPARVAAGATLTVDGTDSFLDAVGSLFGSIDVSAGGAALSSAGLLDAVTITLGNDTTPAAIVGANLAAPGGQVRLTPPSLGPDATVLANGLAGFAVSRNQGTVIVQSGTLTLTGNNGMISNAGLLQTAGGLLIAGGLTDYQAGNPIPVGQTQIGNGGIFKLVDATGLARNHVNARFIDNNGTFEIATHPGTGSDTITINGWVAGAVIMADFADTSQFDPASNSLRFSNSAAPGEVISVSLGTAHIYSADELTGLGTGTITTDFIASPITNIFPPATQSAPQWLGLTGSFGDANLWTPIGVPDATATASLAGTIAYVVSQTGIQTVGGLILSNGQATLSVGGILTTASIDLQAGTLNLVGALRNASITARGGALLASGGTLDSIGWRGALEIIGSLSARNGLALAAEDGSLTGQLNIASGGLNFVDSETLDNAAIALGGVLSGSAALGLGSHTHLTVQGLGTLIATTTLATAGTITVSAGQTLTVGTQAGFSSGTLVNSGAIAVDGGTLVLLGSVRNSGIIAISNGGEADIGNTSLAALLAAGLNVDPSSRIVISGTFDLGGGTVDFSATGPLAGAVFNGATLFNGYVDARPGGFSGSVVALNGIAWRGPLNVGNGHTLTVDSLSHVVDAIDPTLPGTIDIAAGGQLRSTGTLDVGQINLGDLSGPAVATLWGGVASFGAFQDPVIGASATIITAGAASLSFARNLGTIIAASGTLTLTGRNNGGNDFGVLNDNGATILASAYTNYVGESAIPTGQVNIANGGVFTAINPAVANRFGIAAGVHARIVFADATGTLAVQASTIEDFSLFPSIYSVPSILSVAGFQAGNVIRVSSGNARFDAATNQLAFYDATTATMTALIDFDPGHLFDPSELSGLGSSSISTGFAGGGGGITACFAAGTQISTVSGLVSVENLQIGDRVMLFDGRNAPVIWLGHRSLDCARHRRPHDVQPIRVMQHAFGTTPDCDLWLSPDHGIFVNGVFIPVRYLDNGATIHQENWGRVTYWHIELARHAVIFAAGLACETYLDTGNRHAFVEGGPSVQLHPEFARAVWSREGCAQLVTQGAELQAVRALVAARAAGLGFTMTDDPDLHISMDGIRLNGVQLNGTWNFNIPAPRTVAIRSRRARPVDTDPTSADGRRLGVAIAHIELNGRSVAFGTGPGWLTGEVGWCWTDGDASLAITEIGVLSVTIALTPVY